MGCDVDWLRLVDSLACVIYQFTLHMVQGRGFRVEGFVISILGLGT